MKMKDLISVVVSGVLLLCATLVGCGKSDVGDDHLVSLTFNWEAATIKDIENAVARGAGINTTNSLGISPLMLAAMYSNDPDVVEFLLGRGADIHAKSPDGSTALMFAAIGISNLDVIDVLIRNGADINAIDNSGFTPLMTACLRNNDPERVACLAQTGANVDVKMGTFSLLTMTAVQNSSNPAILDQLVKYGANVNETNHLGYTALMATALSKSGHGAPVTIERLIKLGASIDHTSPEGETALSLAVQHNSDTQVVEKLVEYGAGLHFRTPSGKSLLMLATLNRPSMIDCLVRLGAGVNEKMDDGSTALLFAAVNCSDPKIIERLVYHGADVNIVDGKGISALLLACLKDPGSAVCNKISQLSNAERLGDVAVFYSKKEDYRNALRWAERAAILGDEQSAILMGVGNILGKGIPENYIKGYAWYLIAATINLNSIVSKSLQDLKANMTPQQIAAGQQLAQQLQQKMERHTRLSDLESSEDPGSRGITPLGYGSGLLVNGGYILTCWHVVESAKTVTVSLDGRDHVAEIIRKDPANDVAVLQTSTLDGGVAIRAVENIHLGQKVFTLGFPHPELQGSGVKFTTGSISSLMGPADTPRYYQISAPLQGGNSGGPLFDEQGNLVGMVAAKLDVVATLVATGDLPQNVNYAIKMDYIRPLLKTVEGVSINPAQTNNPNLLELIDGLKQSVVMIKVY